MLILRFWQRVGGTFCNFDTFCLVWQEKIPEQGWEKVDMKSIGEAGKELHRDEIGDNESNQQRQGGMGPEGVVAGAEGEAEGGEEKDNADEASFEEKGDGLILDNFLGTGVRDGVKFVHGDAGATETDAKEDGARILRPGGKGGSTKAETDIGGFGNIAIKDWVSSIR